MLEKDKEPMAPGSSCDRLVAGGSQGSSYILKIEGDIGPFECCTRIIGRHGHDAFNLKKLQLVPTYYVGFEFFEIKSTKRM